MSDVDPALTVAAVVGGKEVSVCQFPSTVTIGNGGCTGTLIHPRVVTTAAHCLNGESSSIRFGGGRNAPGSFSLTGKCKSGARGESGVGDNTDWGYCVLPEDERLKKLPITPPLVGCEAERYLKAGAAAWIVGYGTTGPDGRGGGVKRAVEVKVNRVSNGTVDVGDRDVGACHGDSGGPIYMQLNDGANDYGLRVFGSTSGPGAAFCDCNCSTTYVDIAMHVKAIEQNEKIDVTPCTDAAGKWAPGPECAAIQTQAMLGSGTFPECTVARTTAAINSCGMSSATSMGTAAGSGGGSAAASGASGAMSMAMTMAAGGGAGQSGGAAGIIGAAAAGLGAAGLGAAAPAAGSGGTIPITAATSRSAAGNPGSQASPGTLPRAGASATATSVQGLSAAGGPATVVGSAPQSSEEDSGCQVSGAPQSSERALPWMLAALWLVTRARRRARC